MPPTSVFPEANGLYEAILASPHDMNLRLVFADWLEDQGNTQAKLIRLQVRLFQTAGPMATHLEQQIAELHWRHQRQWNGPLHRFLSQTPLRGEVGSRRSRIRGWHFDRGCVESLEVEPQAVLEHAEILFRLGPIRQLRFRRPEWGLDRVLRDRRDDLLRLESIVFPTEGDHRVIRRLNLPGVILLVGLQNPRPVVQ